MRYAVGMERYGPRSRVYGRRARCGAEMDIVRERGSCRVRREPGCRIGAQWKSNKVAETRKHASQCCTRLDSWMLARSGVGGMDACSITHEVPRSTGSSVRRWSHTSEEAATLTAPAPTTVCPPQPQPQPQPPLPPPPSQPSPSCSARTSGLPTQIQHAQRILSMAAAPVLAPCTPTYICGLVQSRPGCD